VQDGVLWRTRVIMLTFRSAESEVVEALELGAFDHVAKPFSLPVLLQRIRRTLQM
jgi:DNA-binding response OmpR family regulator